MKEQIKQALELLYNIKFEEIKKYLIKHYGLIDISKYDCDEPHNETIDALDEAIKVLEDLLIEEQL